jgi:hypothetical protein
LNSALGAIKPIPSVSPAPGHSRAGPRQPLGAHIRSAFRTLPAGGLRNELGHAVRHLHRDSFHVHCLISKHSYIFI